MKNTDNSYECGVRSEELGVVVTLRFAPAECLRCQFAPVAPLRSALHSYRTFTTRGLYFIDRCGFDCDVL